MTRQSLSLAKLTICVAAFALASLTLAGAQTESVIHSFQSTSVFDGIFPLSPVATDKNGAVYGVTTQGGKHGPGTVYKLAPPAAPGGVWKQNILYSFTGGADGAGPIGGVVLTKGGKIYGTTQGGGQYGEGTVYELSPPTRLGSPWTETVLYNFTGSDDGAVPLVGVIAGPGGRLYGTTTLGGRNKFGAVFAISPPSQSGRSWTERVLYSFQADSFGGASGLVLSPSGSLYGTIANAEQVFQLSPPPTGSGAWTESVLYTFTSADTGLLPGGGVILDGTGALYGVTAEGGLYFGGLVYQLSPPSTQGGAWTENVLYSFSPGSGDGSYPDGGVIFDSSGALYGTTSLGGDGLCTAEGPGCGTVFKLSPPATLGEAWTESFLYSFQGVGDGAYPSAGVFLSGASLYGPTWMGGTGICESQQGQLGCGTIFQITQ